jgi:hypothetical protein
VSNQLRFVPWLRRGLASSVPRAAAASVSARAGFGVTLRVSRDAAVEDVTTTVRLFGPGDVLQIDPRQIIRTEPRPLSQDFEPNYLAAVEFDSPELPWLFTPDPTPPAGDAGRLTPWIALVVVRRDRATIVPNPARPVPTLVLEDATGELPDPTQSWAWAHVQLAGTDAPLDQALSGPPERTLSRLVCPRRLAPSTQYVACVVPTYLAGRQAGLAQPVTATPQAAWPAGATGKIELPVYWHWEFSTGPEGDFESLVRRLTPRVLDAKVGLRPVDISRAGSGLPVLAPGSAGSVLGLEGALRSPAMAPTVWPDPVKTNYQGRLEAELSARQGQATEVVRPPVYGADQAGVPTLTAPAAPAWLRQLNLDPRHRVAAALGVRLVQEQQEQLMASAWDQAGELERANQVRRQAQLARAVAASVREKRLAHLPPDAVLRVTEPAHARVRAAGSAAGSLLATVRQSVFPEAAVSPPFRRSLRPLGPVGRRLAETVDRPVARLVEGLARGEVDVPMADVVPGTVQHDLVGAQQLDQVTAGVPTALGWRLVDEFRDVLPRGALAEPSAEARPAVSELAPAAETEAPGAEPEAEPGGLAVRMMPAPIPEDLPDDVGETLQLRRRRLSGINRRFRAAAQDLQQHLGELPAGAAARATALPPPTLPLDSLAPQLVGRGGRLDPEVTVPQAVAAAVRVPAGVAPSGADVLAPLAFAPSFPQPMYRVLSELSPESVLPGAEHVPAETVSVLQANARFIEAFMVGLSHEMGRELAWRGFTAAPRSTFFRQFWDVRGRDPGAPGPSTDIPPIATWPLDRGLGANATRVGGREMLVLLLRGELVRRYATASVYAVRAATPQALGTQELYPEFRGQLAPDILFVGFGLTPAEARGSPSDPGWFFVIQEQVLEPRFGFDALPETGDAARFGGVPASWSGLTWGHLVTSEAAFGAMTHAPVDGPTLNPQLRTTLEGATWGLNAAHMAHITLQRPMRIAVHANAMLPPTPAARARITGIRPASGSRGQALTVEIDGQGLDGVLGVDFGVGIRAELRAVAATVVSARLTIDPASALGARPFALATFEGATSSAEWGLSFSVTPGAYPYQTTARAVGEAVVSAEAEAGAVGASAPPARVELLEPAEVALAAPPRSVFVSFSKEVRWDTLTPDTFLVEDAQGRPLGRARVEPYPFVRQPETVSRATLVLEELDPVVTDQPRPLVLTVRLVGTGPAPILDVDGLPLDGLATGGDPAGDFVHTLMVEGEGGG